jgi:hypothetical protein
MGCKIAEMKNRTYLGLRLYDKRFGESWEGTKIPKTLPPNSKERQRLERIAAAISLEMENGTFDYLKWFPHGNRTCLFEQPKPEPIATVPVGFEDFYQGWIKTSVVTSKPANGGQVKTGQWTEAARLCCFSSLPPDWASPFWYANCGGRI